MKNFFKTLLVVFVVVISVFAFTGCKDKKASRKSIIGSWADGSYTYTFNEDGTGNYAYDGTKMEFTYEDNGKEVTILYNGNTISTTYAYRIEGKKFIIKDSFGNDIEYIKK